MKGRYILFPAIYIGGELQKKDVDIKVECSSVHIEGELRKQAWNPVDKRFQMMYGFFIEFAGVEYGTINMTEQQFSDACSGLCCGGGNTNQRIHVGEFAIEFV